MKLIGILVGMLLVLSCGDKEDGNNSGGSGGNSSSSISTVQIELSSSDVTTFSLFKPLAVCSLSIGGSNHSGNCFTPISMTAKVAQINLGNSYGGAPARLIDFSATAENDPFNGPHGVLGLSSFDFAASAQNTNPYSDDNIQGASNSYFNTTTLIIGAIELKFEIPSGNVGVGDNFWTVRYMFLPQNPLDKSTIDSCVTSTPIRNTIASGGDMYASPAGFQQGDILVCQKATSGETCVDGDFQWVNSADGALSSTRPANPVKLSGTHLIKDDSCEDGGGNLVMGGAEFRTSLSPAIRMSKSRAAEDCLYKYSYQTNCTTTGSTAGSCSDTAEEGFGISVGIDFDLTESLFVESTVDLDSDNEASLRQNLDLILPKPMYVENYKAVVGTGDDTDLDATISISIDNSVATTALEDRGEDPAKYDSDFCFIPEEQSKPRLPKPISFF